MAEHTLQFLVTIQTEKELQAEDVAVALTGTGNACCDPRHDQIAVALVETADLVMTLAAPLRYYRCAACGQRHRFDERCLEAIG